MANINEILARAAALRDETALNSISPERAGGIMYDTLIALNELWLQQGAALVISKIYASVDAMEADTAPVSDISGKPLRPGQIVVIASQDEDNGSVYRYNGTDSPSWSLVGNIGNLEPVDSLDSDSTQLPLAAHQGKVLDEKISQLGQKLLGVDSAKDTIIDVDSIAQNYVYNVYGAYSQTNSYKSVNVSVNPGELIVFSIKPSIITAFGSSFKQADFIEEIVAAKTIVVPAGCHLLSFGYYVPNYAGGAICIRLQYQRITKFADFRIENTVTQTSAGAIQDNNNYDCCFFYCKDALGIKISSSDADDTANASFITFYDAEFEYLDYVDTPGFKLANIPTDAVFACLNLYHASGSRAGDNFYIDVCLPNIIAIMREGPSFMEFARSDYNKKGKAAVGMHGYGEANLCWNMDYINNIHKYYDKTIAAAWLALQGYSTCIQYSPANIDDSGDNDIWHLAGDLYALWLQNHTGKLVTGTSENEEKGDACFSGNRALTGGITFAGLTDCVIEGNRKKGQRGDVFINTYNNGDVYLALGGGLTQIGGRLQLKDVTPPSSANDTGRKGEIRFDANYIYICIATNTWKRVALESW